MADYIALNEFINAIETEGLNYAIVHSSDWEDLKLDWPGLVQMMDDYRNLEIHIGTMTEMLQENFREQLKQYV
jgi:lysyl-tRNA synthetase class I